MSRKTVWMLAAAGCGLVALMAVMRGKYWLKQMAYAWLHLLPVCPADEAVQGMHVPDGFQVSLVAAEPAVSQPIGMTIDQQGRLWVAECRSYPKWNQRSADQVLIFADNDGDGSLETRSIFADGLSNLSGIEVGLGGVWLLCTPNLLFIPDADADGRPDGPATVVLDGFDAHPGMAHHVANHLLFGPDGWLYGCLGFSSNALVAAPGTAAGDRVALSDAIWRVHPHTGQFEVVASGTCNPWGLDFDASGELFVSNNVLSHLWQIVPGGRYRRHVPEGERADNRELMSDCADHKHWQDASNPHADPDQTGTARGGHAHAGLIIYQGDNFPAEYRGAAFLCNVRGNSVNCDLLDYAADEVVAHHGGDLIQASDLGFRAIDLKYGPDGSVFICDWNARGMCHGSDYNAAVPTGRIYRIAYGSPQPVPVSLDKLTDEELVALDDHANEWFVRRARLVLAQRAQDGRLRATTRGQIAERARDTTRPASARLRSLWTWHATCVAAANDNETDLRWELLADTAAEIRGWAVRLLAEEQPLPAETLERLVRLAEEDDSPRVLRELISALHRLESAQRLDLATTLTRRISDEQPRNWQRLAWYALEPLVDGQPLEMVELDRTVQSSLLSQAIARRLAEQWAAAGKRPEVERALERLIAELPVASAAWQAATLTGLHEGLRANRRAAPNGWRPVQTVLMSGADGARRDLISSISARFGDLADQDKLLATVRDRTRATEDRLRALADCLARPNEKVAALVRQTCHDAEPRMRRAAILGYASCDLDPAELWDQYPTLGPAERQALMEVAAGKPRYAARFLDEVESGRIPPAEIRAEVAGQLFALNDPALTARLNKVWGSANSGDGDAAEEIARLERLITREALASADKPHGRELFNQVCAQCHTLFGEGRALGPDLTAVQRDDAQRLIVDIVDPSARVARQFQVTLIETDVGRVVSGVLEEESEQQVVIRTVNATVPIDAEEIVARRLMPQSLMPKGVLRQLSDSDIQDLFGYLMSRSKIEPALETAKQKDLPR